ncbi:MAG: peptide deformylase [Chloroflexi bacterium]|nr:peptide deformylase [Chloroflexota bacterium]
MAIRTIRTFPDPVLREKAKQVPVVDESVKQLINDMVETVKAAPGVGLAAPQIGVSLRVIVVDVPEKGIVALVNPQVIRKGGAQVCEEGCLSLPGYKAELTRCVWIRVKGMDREGNEVRLKGRDLLAQILEHEIDHLNGVLYIDRLESKDKLVPVPIPVPIEEKATSEASTS